MRGEPFGAWFSDETTSEVFGPAETTMAGAFNPPRKAVPVKGGYKLSGQTTFNSNCHAANWVLGLANIYEADEPRLGEDGIPETLITLFPMSDAEIIDNWETLGMRGTGSHDIRVENIFVPESRAVPFVPMETPSSAYSGPLHRTTVWPPVAINAVSAIGIAQAAIDAFIDLADIKTPAYTCKDIERPVGGSATSRQCRGQGRRRKGIFLSDLRYRLADRCRRKFPNDATES